MFWRLTDIDRVFQKRDVDVTGPWVRGSLLRVYTAHRTPINSRYLCRTSTVHLSRRPGLSGRWEISPPPSPSSERLTTVFGLETSRRGAVLLAHVLRTAELFAAPSHY